MSKLTDYLDLEYFNDVLSECKQLIFGNPFSHLQQRATKPAKSDGVVGNNMRDLRDNRMNRSLACHVFAMLSKLGDENLHDLLMETENDINDFIDVMSMSADAFNADWPFLPSLKKGLHYKQAATFLAMDAQRYGKIGDFLTCLYVQITDVNHYQLPNKGKLVDIQLVKFAGDDISKSF